MSPRLSPIAAALSLALAGGVLATAVPAQAQSTDPTVDVRVMTLNIKVTLPPGKWAADAQHASQLTDILAMQEAEQQPDRDAALAMFHAQGWDAWYPKVGGGGDEVAWDASKFSFVSGTSTLVIRKQRGVTPDRYINTVLLRQVGTDQTIAVVNTHTINRGAVDAGLKPNSRTPKLKKNLSMLHDAILQAATITPNVVATGDLNVNYMRDRNLKLPGLPTDVLGPIVDFDMPIGRTYDHGRTELDYVMTLKGGGLTAVPGAAQIVPDFRSDHRGVVVGMDIAGSSPGTPPPAARFAPGVVKNKVHGTHKQRRKVLRTLNRAINNTPAGSAIHVATADINDGAVLRALTRAHRRGVYVQVILRGARLNARELALRKMLGSDTSQRSWLTGCTSPVCLRTSARMTPTTLLVSQAGLTTAFKAAVDRPLDHVASHRPTSARIATDLPTYNRAFDNYFRMIS